MKQATSFLTVATWNVHQGLVPRTPLLTEYADTNPLDIIGLPEPSPPTQPVQLPAQLTDSYRSLVASRVCLLIHKDIKLCAWESDVLHGRWIKAELCKIDIALTVIGVYMPMSIDSLPPESSDIQIACSRMTTIIGKATDYNRSLIVGDLMKL